MSFGDFKNPLACVRSIQTKPYLAYEPKYMSQAKDHWQTNLINFVSLPKLFVFPFIRKNRPIAWIHMSHARKVNTEIFKA